jgi:hypothetical protein
MHDDAHRIVRLRMQWLSPASRVRLHNESILTRVQRPVCINPSFELATLIYLSRFAAVMSRKDADIATVLSRTFVGVK